MFRSSHLKLTEYGRKRRSISSFLTRMCRLLVVKSTTPVLLAHILTAPAHSIINQASDSRLRLDARSINADGFGVGWYPTAEEHDAGGENKPCIFRMSVSLFSQSFRKCISILTRWNGTGSRLLGRIRTYIVSLTSACFLEGQGGVLMEMIESNHPWFSLMSAQVRPELSPTRTVVSRTLSIVQPTRTD